MVTNSQISHRGNSQRVSTLSRHLSSHLLWQRLYPYALSSPFPITWQPTKRQRGCRRRRWKQRFIRHKTMKPIGTGSTITDSTIGHTTCKDGSNAVGAIQTQAGKGHATPRSEACGERNNQGVATDDSEAGSFPAFLPFARSR